MKTKHIIIVLMIILSYTVKAQQNKQALSAEFVYGINGYSMGKLNEILLH
jgi:hypothetical protein